MLISTEHKGQLRMMGTSFILQVNQRTVQNDGEDFALRKVRRSRKSLGGADRPTNTASLMLAWWTRDILKCFNYPEFM